MKALPVIQATSKPILSRIFQMRDYPVGNFLCNVALAPFFAVGRFVYQPLYLKWQTQHTRTSSSELLGQYLKHLPPETLPKVKARLAWRYVSFPRSREEKSRTTNRTNQASILPLAHLHRSSSQDPGASVGIWP